MPGPSIEVHARLSANVKAFGKALVGEKTLEDMKSGIDDVLQEADGPVVVLMDDIDRLDTDEICAVFKLLKLIADFDHISYVTAFDPAVVSAALGRRYPFADGEDVGEEYVEKVVQLPLSLPVIPVDSLSQFTLQRVEDALSRTTIELTDEDAREFVTKFHRGLLAGVRTPRQAVRYGNALLFCLPLLRDEVSMVDLLLIEGARMLFPHAHAQLAANGPLLLQSDDRDSRDDRRERRQQLRERLLEPYSPAEVEALTRLLGDLFPAFAAEGWSSGAPDPETAARQRRICTPTYFGHYFSYGVPSGELSDVRVKAFLEEAASLAPEAITDSLDSLIKSSSAGALLRKLVQHVRAPCPPSLALAVSCIGESLPGSGRLFAAAEPFSQGAILLTTMVEGQEELESRVALAAEIARSGGPLSFVREWFWYLKRAEADDEDDKPLGTAGEGEVAAIIVERFQVEANVRCLFSPPTHTARDDLAFWAGWGNADDTRAHVQQWVTATPECVFDLLECFAGTSTSLGDGSERVGDISRNDYDTIVGLADAEVVIAACRTLLGDELDDPEYYDYRRRPQERLAHQFADVHRQALEGGSDEHPD